MLTRKSVHVSVEQPDKEVVIDFLDGVSRGKKNRRACVVTVKVENGQLLITAKGCDDMATILCDEAYDLPEEDRRH